MSADREQLRQALVAALPHESWCHYDMDCCGCTCEDARVLAVEPLLPVVEAHTRAARADELEQAAKHRMNGSGGRPIGWLLDRAAALRTDEGDRP